jgi:pimeloyl-ACP methyl ester carboxylesterase
MSSETVTLQRPDGTRHCGTTAGEGAANLLFVHGFPFDHSMWDAQIRDLAPAARILAPDLRGLGKSDLPASGRASLADHADDLAAWMDASGMDRAVLVGLSMGGYIAFEAWRRHRKRFAGLALVDTTAAEDTPAGKKARVQTRESILLGGMSAVSSGLLTACLGETTRATRPAVVQTVRHLILSTPAGGAVAAVEAMRQRPDSTGDLAGIDVPTSVIVGDEDSLTPPAVAREMARRIPKAELVTVPDAGHLTPLEAPAAVTRALRTLLRRVR